MSAWLVTLSVLSGIFHMGFAASWCVVNKRSAAESAAIIMCVTFAWPLFAARMVVRGYKNYLVREWPENFWE